MCVYISTAIDQMTPQVRSVHDFVGMNIDGKDVALAEYKGKMLLIVNVASKCGFGSRAKPEDRELVAAVKQAIQST